MMELNRHAWKQQGLGLVLELVSSGQESDTGTTNVRLQLGNKIERGEDI